MTEPADLLAKISVEGNYLDRIAKLESRVAELERREVETEQLDRITNDLGEQNSGEFRAGEELSPGEGFTGVRVVYPPVQYEYNEASRDFCVVAVDGDVAQAGFTADGEIVARVGEIADFTMNGPDLMGGSGTSAFGISSDPAKPLLWGGNETPVIAPLQVWKNGVGYLGTATNKIALDGVNGLISLGAPGSAGLHIDGVNQRIYSNDYVTGQRGFMISAPYGGRSYMEIDDLRARGEIHSAVFVTGETQVKAGSQIIAPSSGKLHNDIDLATVTSIDITDPPSGHEPLFEAGDAVRIKTTGIDVWFEIDSIDDAPSGYITYGVTHKSGSTSGTVYAGVAVTNYKQIGSGIIFLTADAENAPYIDIEANEKGTPWVVMTSKVRLGNLTGLWNSLISSGYGLALGKDIGATTPTGLILCTEPIELPGVIGTPKANIIGYDSAGNVQAFWDSENGLIGADQGRIQIGKDGISVIEKDGSGYRHQLTNSENTRIGRLRMYVPDGETIPVWSFEFIDPNAGSELFMLDHNGGAEDGDMTHWERQPYSLTMTASTEDVYDGAYSFRGSTMGSVYYIYFSDALTINPIKEYIISFASKATSSPMVCLIGVEVWWYLDSTILSHEVIYTSDVPEDWTLHSKLVTPPPTANKLCIKMCGNVESGKVYYDNFSVKEVANPVHIILSDGEAITDVDFYILNGLTVGSDALSYPPADGEVLTKGDVYIGRDAGANAMQIFNSKAMGVRVIRTATQTLTQTQYTPLEWNLQTDTYSHGANQSDDTSPNNDMWTGTYPTRLYAKYAGWYMGGGGLEFNQSAATEPGIGIRVVMNGSIVLAQERYKEVAAGFPPALSISTGMFYMHVDDYIEVHAYTGSGNQNTAQAASLTEHYKNFGFLVRVA